MDAPLLYDSGASSSGFDANNFNLPAHRPFLTINSYAELTQKSKESERPDFFINVVTLSIHLEEFKRDIFKVIDDNEFNILPKFDWFRSWNTPSPNAATNMIAALLKETPRLKSLNIMLFPALVGYQINYPKVESLTVTHGFFDEFARIFDSIGVIKSVTLDGIIPRRDPEDISQGEYKYKSESVQSGGIEFLKITCNSVILNSDLRMLLGRSPHVSELHYDQFSKYQKKSNVKLDYLLDEDRVTIDDSLINEIGKLKELKTLSIYEDTREYFKVETPEKSLSRLTNRNNILKLSTTSHLCYYPCAKQFTNLQEYTLWWRHRILALQAGGNALTKDIDQFPNGLKIFRMYIPLSILREESNELGLEYYVENVSTGFDQIVKGLNFQADEIKIYIYDGPTFLSYSAPIGFKRHLVNIRFDKSDNYQSIFNQLWSILEDD